MYESKDLKCPNCESVTRIHIGDPTCQECGADIKELNREKSEKVREVMGEVRETVNENSYLNLRRITKHDDVIRADVQADGSIKLNTDRMSDESYDADAVIERQTNFSSLVADINGLDNVSDVEQWKAAELGHVKGSKYGMEPNLSHLDECDAVLLIGTTF
jgi:uncharacterized Zn finger protein (UPF0148 family)